MLPSYIYDSDVVVFDNRKVLLSYVESNLSKTRRESRRCCLSALPLVSKMNSTRELRIFVAC